MTLPAHHAWTLRRLFVGLPVNGELTELPEPFRALAVRLDGFDLEARREAWNAFLADRDDGNEIVRSLTVVDPEWHRPEAPPGDEPGDDWRPIRLGSIPPAEPFPLDVLPVPARDLAEAAARSIGCPVDFPAAAILAAASGLIGRSATIFVKQGYFESASVYLALVGDSSDGKSPALDAAMGPIRTIADKLHDEHAASLAEWAKAPDAERGDRPKPRRIDTSNPTVEALAPILARNPRGLIVLPDEFTGLCLSMGQYKAGKGADKQFYLSAWSGSRVVVDRVKDQGDPTVVPKPYLTLAGGMTPGRLGTLAANGGDEDGFMARLLFTYPEPVKGRTYSEEGILEQVAAGWQALLDQLWARPMRDLDGKPAPHVVKMNFQARALWASKCQAHLDEQEADDFPRSLKGTWGKLQSYAARFALILACLRHAADPTLDPAATPTLDGLLIHDAWRLVSYFKSHARRIHAAMAGKADNGGDDVCALLGWIARNNLAEVSIRDIDRNFDRFKQDPAARTDALEWMIARNLIRRPEPKDSTPKPGRKPSPRFEVNPALWELPRFRQFRQNGAESRRFVGNVGNALDAEEEV